jgi:molecular chaperone HtpG
VHFGKSWPNRSTPCAPHVRIGNISPYNHMGDGVAKFQLSFLESALPPSLYRSLLHDSTFAGESLAAAGKFEDWFENSGTPFFKNFTDHSFWHSIDVFRTAAEITSDEAYHIISCEDLNVLFLSCLAHDAGLHITEDMFSRLVDRSNDKVLIGSFDEIPWPTLWDEFLNEAKRFDQKRLMKIFGDVEPVREPPKDVLSITDRDRLLIGEFLRRHHTRLAHEIAVAGIPAGKSRLMPLLAIDPAFRDIVGLVARSHGQSLRSTFQYIGSQYHIRDFQKIHIIYLMVLLRIGDLLQIQSARAPEIFNMIHKISSPFSENEWRVHQSIGNITTSIPDPEAIFVSAKPPSIRAFLRVNDWLKELQSELDISWAVLGEVYGRFEKERLPDLKIALRRVSSNLEDAASFQETVPYVPERIQFTVAEAELLNLLIAPLYGDSPLYGLRELTQNSADAVLELSHLATSGLAYSSKDQLRDCDIEIVLNKVDGMFSIRDNGVGMTLEVVKNYFLKAGASFRFSDAWKQDYADQEGKSKIARSGRFGVGALSAFLIGNKISIFTRHYSDESGYGVAFECSIEDDSIEVTKVRGPIGTSISIKTSIDRLESLVRYIKGRVDSPSFYYLPGNVAIRFKVQAENISSFTVEGRARSAAEWREVSCADYEKVSRRDLAESEYYYLDRSEGRPWVRTDPYIYCNHIFVGSLEHDRYFNLLQNQADGAFSFRCPTLSIVDHNGRLPLTLSRQLTLPP